MQHPLNEPPHFSGRVPPGTAHHQDLVPVYYYHTLDNPFCPLPACKCHTNQQEIAELLEQIKAGLLTLREAADFVEGKLVY